MINRIVFLFLSLYLSTVSLLCFSQEGLSQKDHSHEAHTHGLAEMTVIFENSRLIVKLETPASNVLGFEYEPGTEKEKAVFIRSEKLLNNPPVLFEVNSSCKIINVDVDFPYTILTESSISHEKHSDMADKNHQKKSHKDIQSSYEWLCENIHQPKIRLHIFDLFSGFETIQSQWIINGKQGLTTLNSESLDLDFRE